MRQLIFTLVIGIAMAVFGRPAEAQQDPTFWVQIESHGSLAAGMDRARDYAAGLQNVNGFVLNGGWYGVVLGPYAEADALAVLTDLRGRGAIPRDSFLTQTDIYRQQFYPVGANLLTAPPVAVATAPAAGQADQQTAEETAPAPVAEGETAATEIEEVAATLPAVDPLPVETPQEARRSEAQLDRDQRAELQIALQWFGYYRGGIDAAFGPGTRAAMAAYQEAVGVDVTGILTTRQRARLLEEYETILSSIGFQTVTDAPTGIEIDLPLAMVAFDRYDPPFAHFLPQNDSGVRVLLISQAGDAATLLGLYDIMQTLKIVPLDGERNRQRDSFTLTGSNDEITSHTFARTANGHVKGFTLIWPADEDPRREVVLDRMRQSFTLLPDSVLPETVGDRGLDQSIDLLSGLEIRRPERSRSGFFVDSRGTVLTALEAVSGCDRVTINEAYDASIAGVDDALGLALLRPNVALAPIDFARFRADEPRLQSEIAVAGYSFDGVLSAPTVTFGQLADVRGLDGEETLKRLALAANPGDAGGPVFDTAGSVLGMLLPHEKVGDRVLPEDVNFAADGIALAEFLQRSGVVPSASTGGAVLTAEKLTQRAADMTVLVSCWN